jgi:hypothetical protein
MDRAARRARHIDASISWIQSNVEHVEHIIESQDEHRRQMLRAISNDEHNTMNTSNDSTTISTFDATRHRGQAGWLGARGRGSRASAGGRHSS